MKYLIDLHMLFVVAFAITAIERIWRMIVEAFAPWLQPLYTDKAPSMPWIAADMEHARSMVKAFTEVVGFAHYRTDGR